MSRSRSYRAVLLLLVLKTTFCCGVENVLSSKGRILEALSSLNQSAASLFPVVAADFTNDGPSESSETAHNDSSNAKTGIIIGSAAAGVVALSVLPIVLLSRKKKKQNSFDEYLETRHTELDDAIVVQVSNEMSEDSQSKAGQQQPQQIKKWRQKILKKSRRSERNTLHLEAPTSEVIESMDIDVYHCTTASKNRDSSCDIAALPPKKKGVRKKQQNKRKLELPSFASVDGLEGYEGYYFDDACASKSLSYTLCGSKPEASEYAASSVTEYEPNEGALWLEVSEYFEDVK